ncbi:ABC-F family ATP-binding cassette domain-containing protein [candidate division KSB1 bacterium]|nr:ABC-F family ATP-binding cassette domain-containing protein [candidate division KSB1 bacterium]
MDFLYLNNVTFSYPGASDPLFVDVSFQCQPGWTGIVGPNGGGKTTLLKLIRGDLQPEAGAIIRPGAVYYAEQSVDERPEGAQEFLASYQRQTLRMKEQLRIQDDWLERWDSLSFGERKRCQIAVAFAEGPAVLLLDEPSNHVDHSCKKFLITALRAYKGIGLLVSHDRELLDTLCSHTLFVDPPDIDIRSCPYSIAAQERERENESLMHEREVMKREVKKLKRRVQQQRQKAEAADRKKSKRELDRKDHDAKAKIDAARLTGKDAVQGRLYRRSQTFLKRATERQQEIQVQKNYTLGITYVSSDKSYKFPITIPAGQVALGSAWLQIPELSLAMGDKVGLVGDNGSGKSTFIRHLVKSLPLHSDELIYIPQEISKSAAVAILQQIQNKSDAEKGEILTIIRRLGSEPSRLLATAMPSPGELRKLMLAQGLQKRPALIIMDEPTNHMDLPSIRCVEKALQECTCSLLLVSHDHVFLQHVVSYFWIFERSDDGSRIVPSDAII